VKPGGRKKKGCLRQGGLTSHKEEIRGKGENTDRGGGTKKKTRMKREQIFGKNCQEIEMVWGKLAGEVDGCEPKNEVRGGKNASVNGIRTGEERRRMHEQT